MGKYQPESKPYSNPYLTGFWLGIVLLAAYLILGTGLGASGGMARIAAAIEGSVLTEHTLNSAYFGRWGTSPLNYYLVYMLIGIIIGGFLSAVLNRRLQFIVERGDACTISRRASYSLAGGLLVGFASRLGLGCTSGQALTGGAMLLTGSLVFLICIFLGGYAVAILVKGQWDD